MITSGTRGRQQLKAKQNLKIQISWTFSVASPVLYESETIYKILHKLKKLKKKKKEKKTND